MIAQADVGEGAAHHHFVVAAARAVGIEVLGLDAVRDQIFSGGAIRLNRAGGRDVVGGDAVAQHGERAHAVQIAEGDGLQRHVFEIRRMLDVGGFFVPGVEIAFGDRQRAPVLVAGENVGIFLAEHFAGDGSAHGCFDFLGRGPDIAEIDGLAGFVVAERFVDDVEIHASGKRVGDDQRRRGEIIRAAERIDAAFEIAIAAEHRDGDEIIVLDGFADRFGERAAVADAGGAAVADEIEAERIEIGPQAGFFDVIGDDFGAGREAGFHPGLGLQAALDGFFGEQAGAEHQRRIRSVGAAGDGGDDDRAVGEIELVAIVLHADVLGGVGERFFEGCFGLRERHAILRALGAGHGGDDGREIEFEAVGENRVGRLVGAEQALLLGVGLDEADLLFVRAR